MPNLLVEESFINVTDNYRFGDSGIYETAYNNRGDLYRAMQREYGRCTGKVYVDQNDGVKSIGWVFLSRLKYEDTGEKYLREVWVTVHADKPTITHNYA